MTVDIEEETVLAFSMQQKLKKLGNLLLAKTLPREDKCYKSYRAFIQKLNETFNIVRFKVSLRVVSLGRGKKPNYQQEKFFKQKE